MSIMNEIEVHLMKISYLKELIIEYKEDIDMLNISISELRARIEFLQEELAATEARETHLLDVLTELFGWDLFQEKGDILLDAVDSWGSNSHKALNTMLEESYNKGISDGQSSFCPFYSDGPEAYSSLHRCDMGADWCRIGGDTLICFGDTETCTLK